jgi:hypothetical protein
LVGPSTPVDAIAEEVVLTRLLYRLSRIAQLLVHDAAPVDGDTIRATRSSPSSSSMRTSANRAANEPDGGSLAPAARSFLFSFGDHLIELDVISFTRPALTSLRKNGLYGTRTFIECRSPNSRSRHRSRRRSSMSL